MKRQVYKGQERRSYIRLDTVLPVEFHLVSSDGLQALSSWQQGFTNNVGQGGICLTINNLDEKTIELLEKSEAKVSLDIDVPIFRKSVSALAKVAWTEKLRDSPG